MRANEFITENSGKFKFLRPGELRGSYTDSQLRALGFRQSRSGTWFIALDKWTELVRTKQISESHNPRVFRRGFESQKDFGKYKLVAVPGRFLLHQKFNEPSDQFTISVFHRGHKVGWVNFEIIDDNLEALDLYVEPKHRRRGLATAIYKFAVELGNDVKPSGKQTALGRAFWATKDLTTESYEDENTDLPSVEQAKAAIPQILQAAQRVYNDWDEEDRDTYAGGGICHIIADAVCDVLNSAGIECTPVSCDYEQHVYVAAKFEEGIYTIDIPYHIYETGGGFSWQKIPDVVFEKNDVVFYRASGDPNDWGNYINETTEDKTYFEAKRRRKKTRRRVYAPIMYGWYGFPTGDSEGGGDGGMAERKLIKTVEKEFINEFGFPMRPGYFRVGDIIAAKDRYGDQFTGQILDISVRPSGKVKELEVAKIKILARDGEKIDYDSNSYTYMQTFPHDPDIKLVSRGSTSQQDVAEDIDYQRHLKLINAHMKKMGYKRLGGGRDAQVYAKQEGSIIKILIPQDEKTVRSAEIPFLEFYKYCRANQKNPHLPKFGKIQGQDYADFHLDGERFVQIAQERLSDIPAPSEYDDMLFDMINSVENNTPLEQKYQGYELFYKTLKSVAQRGRELGFENDFIKSDDDFNIMLRGKTLVITDPWLDASLNESVAEGNIGEMAAAGNFGNRMWYHGTNKRALRKILETGVVKPFISDSNIVGEAIYLSSDINEALTYGKIVLAIPNNVARNFKLERFSSYPHGYRKKYDIKKDPSETYHMVIKAEVPLKYWRLVDLKTGNLVKISKSMTEQGVAESLDQPYRLAWSMGVHGDVDAYATLPDGTPLSIMFNQENEHFWTVEFYRSNSQGVTGEGDSQRIFATVLGAIKKFVKKYQPRYIVFSAVKEDDPTGSRAKLYERMVQKYARQLGYEIEVLDEGYRTTFTLYQSESLNEQDVVEGKNNDTAISLSRLGKFHKGLDLLAEFVPERATARYALHPEKWESTFFSLTNKDPRKLKYFGPKEISIPPGTLVGDMAIANRFYRAETAEEKQKYAEAYRQSLKPYPVDVSQYRMPELLIPSEGVFESTEQTMSLKDTLAYLQKVMGTESHEDWRNDIINNNDYFVLKDIPLNSLWIDLPMLDKSNVEKYKQMDFSKAPPIVISSNGNIIDGYHRANVAKALNIPTLKAWVGVKKQGVTENFADGRNPQDKGDSRRYNVPTKGKISTLRKIAKQGGRRGQLAHWMANMRSGKQKTKK